jgi:hypothetical protein
VATQELQVASIGSPRPITCTGVSQQWEVHAAPQGREVFTEGDATVVASARTTDRGETDDAHQWLVNVTLVRE